MVDHKCMDSDIHMIALAIMIYFLYCYNEKNGKMEISKKVCIHIISTMKNSLSGQLPGALFDCLGLMLIEMWICNYISCKVWDEINSFVEILFLYKIYHVAAAEYGPLQMYILETY